jgi:hypothetical protein
MSRTLEGGKKRGGGSGGAGRGSGGRSQQHSGEKLDLKQVRELRRMVLDEVKRRKSLWVELAEE